MSNEKSNVFILSVRDYFNELKKTVGFSLSPKDIEKLNESFFCASCNKAHVPLSYDTTMVFSRGDMDDDKLYETIYKNGYVHRAKLFCNKAEAVKHLMENDNEDYQP